MILENSEFNNCPICKTPGVKLLEDSSCRQCKSDFSPYQVIHDLKRRNIEMKNNNKYSNIIKLEVPKIFLILQFLFLFLFSLVGFSFLFYTKNAPVQYNMPHPTVNHTIEKIDLKIDPSDYKIIPEKFNHIIQDNQTLWDIAKIYWGDGNLYPLFLEWNDLLSLYNYKSGDKIVIQGDSYYAKNLYDNFIIRISNKKYYRYMVRPHDTWLVIQKRFNGKINNKIFSVGSLKNINSNKLRPFMRINVPLD